MEESATSASHITTRYIQQAELFFKACPAASSAPDNRFTPPRYRSGQSLDRTGTHRVSPGQTRQVDGRQRHGTRDIGGKPSLSPASQGVRRLLRAQARRF